MTEPEWHEPRQAWMVPVYWTTTPIGDAILAYWERQGLVGDDERRVITPWIRDLAEAAGEMLESAAYFLGHEMIREIEHAKV